MGFYHVGAREYDPRTARWLQRDPIGVSGGHPNVYLYCANDPVNATDPSGLSQDEPPDAGIIEFDDRGRALPYVAVSDGINKRIATPLRLIVGTAGELNPLSSASGVIYGRDCFDDKLSFWQRGAQVLGAIPVVGTFFKGERVLSKVIKLKKVIQLAGGGTLHQGSEIRSIVKIAEGHGIDEVSRLVSLYGGKASNWKKMKGVGKGIYEGRPALIETHWYECHGVGRVEFKGKVALRWLGD